MINLTLPERTGQRPAAEAFLGGVPASLHGVEVEIDCTRCFASMASFIDELVKEILGKREATSLSLVVRREDELTGFYARSSAERRNVMHRLRVRLG